MNKDTKRKLDEYRRSGRIEDLSEPMQYDSYDGYVVKDLGATLNPPSTNRTVDRIDYNPVSEAGSVKDTSIKPDNIMGLPFYFNALADPNRRVYSKTYMADLPIVTMIPGKPQFAKHDESVKGFFTKATDMMTDTADFESKTEKGFFDLFRMNSDSEIHSWLLQNAKNSSANKDLRYYGFRPNFQEYAKHLQLMISTVGIKMGAIGGLHHLSDSFERDFGQRGIKFYCTKSSSVSESLDNDFGASAIAHTANGVSDMAKEIMFLSGTQKGSSYQGLDDVGSELAKDIEEMGSRTGFLSKFTGALGDMAGTLKHALFSGSNLHFPEVWKDSSFSRSYQLDFRFVSPYGDPKAIYEYIYLPFLMLMTMTMPKMDSLMGYYSPYILRVDMPGVFTSDMAVITSMSWKKGGSDNLFTKDGLPLEMEVSVTIKDLYPVLAMTHQYSVLKYNVALHGFLDNMAGLSIERFEPMEDLKRSIKMRTSYATGGVERTKNAIHDWAANISRNVLNQNH